MPQKEQTTKPDQRDVLDAAMTAGHILLENGAEIFRVEETIDRICHHFGVQSENAFVLSNGIFLTSGDEHEKRFARVEHIPVRGAQLHRVPSCNNLRRASLFMAIESSCTVHSIVLFYMFSRSLSTLTSFTHRTNSSVA